MSRQRLARKIPSSPDSAAVVGAALLRAADRLKVPARTVAKAVGLSESSVSRMGAGEFKLTAGTKPFEHALLFIRMFRSLDAITGGDETAASGWLRAENSALNARPLDLIDHLPGMIDVLAYLDARRAIV